MIESEYNSGYQSAKDGESVPESSTTFSFRSGWNMAREDAATLRAARKRLTLYESRDDPALAFHERSHIQHLEKLLKGKS